MKGHENALRFCITAVQLYIARGCCFKIRRNCLILGFLFIPISDQLKLLLIHIVAFINDISTELLLVES